MILTDKNRKHAEAIVKHCIDSGMDSFAANGPLWNHLVRVLKRMEIFEELAAEQGASAPKAPNKKSAPLKYPCRTCGSKKGCHCIGSDPCPRR